MVQEACPGNICAIAGSEIDSIYSAGKVRGYASLMQPA